MKKKKLTLEQLKKRREQREYSKRIYQTFTDAGFAYVATRDVHFIIGGRDVEIDAAYVHENLILLCEDTTETTGESDHVAIKNEAARIIETNKHVFLEWFANRSSVAKTCCNNYTEARIKIFSLYFSKYHSPWSAEDEKRFSSLRLVSARVLDYFRWMSQCIKKSAAYEIYKYLGLSTKDIGEKSSSTDKTDIVAPIVCPSEFVGGDKRVRVVSFMMAPKDILKMAYVMRKDGWRNVVDVYQRLVDKKKIRKIREYICSTKATFYNNIIVALPDGVKIIDENGDAKSIFKVEDFSGGLKLSIAKEINSIGIIDGQHRVYAYHEGGVCDAEVEALRKQLRLLVTGIVFSPSVKELERGKIQSKIFLDINENAKPVNASLVLHIKKMQDPFADTSIAQDVIERLNRNGVFKDKFRESALSQKGIPTASIIKFALRYLVTLTPSSGKGSFISSWSGNAKRLKEGDGEALKEYVKYCAECLSKYFAGIKQAFEESWKWDDASTLLPSVVTINGFLIALCKKLVTDRPHDVEYYRKKFKQFKIDFSRSKFEYRSSQYHKFAQRILEDVWR